MNSTTLISAQCLIMGDFLPTVLRGAENKNIFSYCATGEHPLLLANSGCSVVAVDSNPVHLALAQLKTVVLRLLPPEGRETLFGLNPFGRRVFLYHRVRNELPENARQFWDAHEHWIRQGILQQGDMDQSLTSLRKLTQKCFGTKTVNKFVQDRSGSLQKSLLTSLRWKIIARRWNRALAAYGFVPEQMRHNLNHLLQTKPLHRDYWLKQFFIPLRNDFAPSFVQWRQSEFPDVRFVEAEVLSYLKRCDSSSFDGFNLGRCLNNQSPSHLKQIFDAVYRVGRHGAQVVFWSNDNAISPEKKRFKNIQTVPEPNLFYDRIGVYSIVKSAD